MNQKIKHGIRLTALAVLLSGVMMVTEAQATCRFVTDEIITPSDGEPGLGLNPAILPFNTVYPFNISRLTGSSEAVGSILYSGHSVISSLMRIRCDRAAVRYIEYALESAPLGVWSGDIGQYSGKIYNTGVEGIGFIARVNFDGFSAGNAAPMKSGGLASPSGEFGASNGANTSGFGVWYQFIKTGPLNYGTIEGAQLPVINTYIEADDGVTSRWHIQRISFSGTVSINRPTCNATEPDKVVNMGTRHQREFANVGDATNWVDSSLTMVCDEAFYGQGGYLAKYYAITNGTNIDVRDYPAPRQNNANTWAVRFTSSTGLIDATQGIIALDSSNGDNANGVGIQLSSSPDAAGIMDLTTGWGGTIDLGSSTFHIPIFARYIRTGDITVGSANGKVIYTVDYQ